MYLTIPFFFTSTVDLVDGQKSVPKVVVDTIDVEIPEVSSSDAPVCLSYLDSAFEWRPRRFRVYGGEFYSSFITMSGMSSSGMSSTRKLSALTSIPSGSKAPLELIHFLFLNDAYNFRTEWTVGRKWVAAWWSKQRNGHPFGAVNALEVAKRHDDARERRVEKLQKAAKGLLGVDGWLNFRTAEPVLAVGNGNLSIHTDFSSPKIGLDAYRPNFGTTNRLLFPVNRMDLAEVYARDAGITDLSAVVQDIDANPGAPFAFDYLSYQSISAALALVEHAAPSLASLPANAVAAWLDLRSQLEEPANVLHSRVLANAETLCSTIGLPERILKSVRDLSSLIDEGERLKPSSNRPLP